MLGLVTNLVLIIFGFGALIFFHELGHFLAARWAGIRTEVFAVGMGTPVFSWRKGIGFSWGSSHAKVVARTGKAARELSPDELDGQGIGATEYSLRWLPIGGFVKMMGQDDVDPGNTSPEPDSYNTCPVGKRMVVVSAGVVANIILAVVVFIIAFMAGVRSEKPVVGAVNPMMPAGQAGIRPGDTITGINGKDIRTFVDIQIRTAMAKPRRLLRVEVEREGELLTFEMEPEKDPSTGLLGIGITPGRSNVLFGGQDAERVQQLLDKVGLGEAGVRSGMALVSAGGRPIEAYEQLEELAERSGGEPVRALWSAVDEQRRPVGEPVAAAVPVIPTFDILRYPAPIADVEQNVEEGLLGLTPLVEIIAVHSGRNSNQDVLFPGDVILRAGAVVGPRMAQLRSELARRKGGEIDMVVLREDVREAVTARVDRDGMLNITIDLAWDLPLIAEPMPEVRTPPDAQGESRTVRTPVSELDLFGGTRIDAVGDTAVDGWPSIREALRRQTLAALRMGEGASLSLTITHPTPGSERETLTLSMSAADVERLHALTWVSEVRGSWFEPMFMTLSAGGNPLLAARMGFEETWKVLVMTYLTIDRLIRGSVGVEQIHGPVGIVHVGTKMADRGVTYLLFFLGIVSVNLAVINFLPIPIVDGGLFLFLIYEKLKGKPPSIAFQNAVTILGLALIATVFLVVTWNDLMRLVG